MNKKWLSLWMAVMLTVSGNLFAQEDVLIRDVHVRMRAPDRYMITGTLLNNTAKQQEIVLRAEIVFYERNVPPGDRPLMVVQKDFIEIVESRDEIKLEIPMIIEGTPPRGAYRYYPVLRVRRLREWHY